MAISLINVATSNGGAVAVTSQTTNVPAGTDGNDTLIWVITSQVATVITTPTGWGVWRATTTTGQSLGIFFRTASSEPASYTTATPSARGAAIMVALRGVDLTTPLDATIPVSGVGTGLFNFPAITPVTTGAWVLGVAGYNQSGAALATPTSTNLTVDAFSASTATGTNVNSTAAFGHVLWTSGALTPNLTAGTTSRTIATTIALRPMLRTPAQVYNRAAILRANYY